ncbi:MAG: M56 family metallopeptidase, partial [Bacteroidota bacterium]|nr:M56 family metallopeptidase [Bacteroidota bacterium]
MSHFLNAENLNSLGWSLLNSIWQIGILWVIYLLIAKTSKRFSAAARYNLALLFSSLGFVWFLYGLTSPVVHYEGIIYRLSFSIGLSPFSAFFSLVLPVLTTIYLLILLIWAVWYVLGFYRLKQNKRQSGIFYSAPLQLFSDRVSAAMGIGKPVSILLANWVDTAQTIGFFKPLVLLPVALVNRLSMEQAETILLHELQHIRRHDYLANICMMIFRAIFFFNPFARLFFKTMTTEREHACDDGVLQWNYPAPVYAEALFNLEKFRQLPNTLCMAADGNNPRLLMDRIRRVTGEPIPDKSPFSPLLSLGLIAALFIAGLNSFSYSPRSGADVQPGILPERQMNASTVAVAEKSSGMDMAEPANVLAKHEPERKPKQASGYKFKARRPEPASVSQKSSAVKVFPAVIFQIQEDALNDPLQYADHAEVRNYSNEKAAEPELPLVVDMNGMPYVPSASFSYMPETDTLQP